MTRFSRSFSLVAGLGLAACLSPPAIRAQLPDDPGERPLTMDEAVALALESNASLREAGLHARAVEARSRGASAFLWPSLALEGGVVRSDDPVAAFGTKLRQGRFTRADLALDALNRPDPVTDWTAGAGASWTVLDPASWAGRSAARWESRAAGLGVERTRQAVVFRTRVLYLGILQARGRLQAARQAEEGARATARRIRSRRDQGILTEADALRADAEVEAAVARRAAGEQALASARTRLAVHLGWDSGRLPVATDTLLLEAVPVPVADGVKGRADLRALEAGVEVARAAQSRAARARLPSMEAFGRFSTHAPDISGEGEENWTLGIQLRWPLFAGFGISAGEDAAEAMRRAAEIRMAQATREARAELDDARRGLESARLQMEAARAGARAAGEGLRLVRRRFDEGMATTADILQAQARAAELESRAVDAAAGYRMALARLDFAAGNVNAPSGASGDGEDVDTDPSETMEEGR